MKKKPVCVLIPAYNEEKVIAVTLKRLLKFVDKKDIFVVDDGSKDKTASIARKYIENVLTVPNNGKANALNEGIKQFKLISKYEFITPTDADSNLSENFFVHILERFHKDKNKKVVCIVGKIVGLPTNWLTSYRLWEYEMTQLIHKSAQAKINAIVVCPGPCTVFRSSIFNKVKYPTGTITEDMDLTFLIHRKKLGKLTFEEKSTSTTQDPNNLRDFTKQITRWYSGFWQCVYKYKIPHKMQKLDMEVALLATEGIFNGLFVLSLLFIIPYFGTINPMILFYAFLADFLLFMLPSTIYVANKYNAWKIILFIPHFYFLRLFSSLIFLKSYGIVILGTDRKTGKTWDSARYSIVNTA